MSRHELERILADDDAAEDIDALPARLRARITRDLRTGDRRPIHVVKRLDREEG